MRSVRARRVGAVVAAVVVLVAGLAVHFLLPDSTASDIAGDVLYTALIYVLLVVVLPRLSPLVIGAISAGWCVAIESFQLTGIPERLAADFPPAVLVLGTVFDPRDLVIGVGVSAALAAIDVGIGRLRGRRASTTSESEPG